ncbi:MAG: hypothetical protein ACRYG4_26930, partial [Janthinobacterium lividum]
VPPVADKTLPASGGAAKPGAAPGAAFGLDSIEQPKRAPARASEKIGAQLVSRVNPGGLGYWIYTLDNGMRWQMTETTELELPDKGMITIRRGSFGGYMMDVGRHASVRVRRLQ